MLVADRYRLVEELGRGAMGEVWRAEDTALGRDVAVKLLLEKGAADHAAERFRQEAQTAARLNHPNVVAVYDFDEDGARGYLVMELVAGRSLRDELATRDTLEIDEACRLAGQAAVGLAAAHARDVVHRDVKPGNLLLAPDGRVKVADFGIARAAMDAGASMTVTGAMLGTSAYLAPERATGGTAEPASDVYALGCVLYEMLCGRTPFAGDPAAVVYQHVDRAPRPPAELRPDIPAALADFVLRMLAKDPAGRPTAADAARFLTDRPAFTGAAAAAEGPATRRLPRVPAAGRGRRAPRRSGALASVLLVSVFVIAGAVGYVLSSGQGQEADRPAPAKPSTSAPGRSQAPDNGAVPTAPAHEKRGPGGRHGKDGPGSPAEELSRTQESGNKGPGAGRDGNEERKSREGSGNKGPDKPRKP